jgi:hypothetical protein
VSAHSLRGGVYFVRLQAGATMDTRKVVLQ